MARQILIADDEEDFLEILTYNLEKEGFDVIAVQDGKAAMDALDTNPDLIILDVMMPEMDGYEVCKAIRAKGIDTPIIFLTAKDSEFDEVLGLEIGGDDYITKPFSPMTLIARVRAHLRKLQSEPTPEIIHIGKLAIDPENYTVKLDGEEIDFTKTEFNLLAYLAQRPNVVHSRETLLSSVWGNDTFVIDRTVDVHVGKVRKKLKDYGQYIETKAGVGYRLNTRRIENGN
ncbi:MAG: response regulator transcription factor [Candidatus Marinimicrobia bacterium]|nr:response regulator transcription factor [Candidatus Neomarinimicrobiota bacterium]MCF7828147.1 response regulator transcription factor [Candidatus Neomarinimicrobiota bacterium]MCF7879678.1 response regulator transcription factor [Candidatus Neomarinimicrobiota bacterium]